MNSPHVALNDAASLSDQEAEPPSLIGQVVGNYRIERELGRGGMGVVYLAIHTKIKNRVAIKMLPSALAADPRHRERLLREARACSGLHDEGLIKIFDYGELESGSPHILMEYLEGELLRDRMLPPGRQMPLPQALRITHQLAAALATAHRSGLIHRDLKPENIMLVPDAAAPGGERAKVLDFGLAQRIEVVETEPAGSSVCSQQARSSERSGISGTPMYMSPEHCRGDVPLDRRTDVYALGIILYEMLCGRPPFFDDTRLSIECQQVFQKPSAPGVLRPGLPAAIDTLVLSMLAKEPELRPAMEQVAQAVIEYWQLPTASPPRAASSRLRTLITWGTRFAIRADMFLLTLLILLLFLAPGTLQPGCAPIAGPPKVAGMVYIDGGSFAMGSSLQDVDDAYTFAHAFGCPLCPRSLYERELPQHQVTVHPYYLDTTEVTNEEFVRWLNQYGAAVRVEQGRRVWLGDLLLMDLYQNPVLSGIFHHNGRFATHPFMEQKPVVYVTWQGSAAFCHSHGKRLPSEAEWEFAARAPDGRRFPWGNQPPDCKGVAFGRQPENREGALCSKHGNLPADVATMKQDVSFHGVHDLGGNVAEWVSDAFVGDYSSLSASATDPLVLGNGRDGTGGDEHGVRGGSWFRPAEACRAAGRNRGRPDEVVADTGFRCARSLKPALPPS